MTAASAGVLAVPGRLTITAYIAGFSSQPSLTLRERAAPIAAPLTTRVPRPGKSLGQPIAAATFLTKLATGPGNTSTGNGGRSTGGTPPVTVTGTVSGFGRE